jgi:exonuclease SbcC
MKILAIRIENLASLEGKTEIDFTQEPLVSAGLFAITGATGAGKSTILDALCLALYAKTPRYLQAKEQGIELHDVKGSTINQGDARGILRDGTGAGFAEVDFMGVDGQHYRAAWHVKRARNKPDGGIQTDTMLLKNITQNREIGGKKTDILREIEQKIGLNFEQFTRAVLLAQGDFTVFLRATKDEKASLLEKLTGTHIYSEISKTIFDKYGIAKQELTNIETQKNSINILTDDEIASYTENKAKIEAEIKILDEQCKAIEQEILWYQTLLSLENNYTKAQTVWEQATENKKNAAAREQQLTQIEEVQKTRTWIDAAENAKKQQEETIEKLKRVTENIANLALQQEQATKEQQEVIKQATKAKEEKQQAIPFLEEAKQLDTLLNERKEQISHAEQAWQDEKKAYQSQQEYLKTQESVLTEITKNIANLEQWIQNNETRKPIAENKALIVSKLSDAQKLLDVLQKNGDLLEKNTENSNTKNVAIEGLQAKFNSQKTALETLQASYDSQERILLQTDIAEIETQKNSTDKYVFDLFEGQGHWKNLYSTQNDFNQNAAILLSNQGELVEKEKLLQTISNQISIAKITKDSSEKLLGKARLAAAENVESLRNQLVEHEPCLVCGSTTHPYKSHNPQLDKVLQELEILHQENVSSYENSLKEESSLKKTCETLRKNSQELYTKQELIQTNLAALQPKWDTCAVKQLCEKIAEADKENWFDTQLQANKAKQSAFKTQIETYNKAKQSLEKVKDNLKDAEIILTNLSDSLKDAQRELQSLQENAKNLQTQQAEVSQNLTNIAQELNPNFTDKDWFTNWKLEPDTFLSKINKFVENWYSKTKELGETKQESSILTAKITELHTQTEKQQAEVHKKETQLAELIAKNKDLIAKRQAIFGGETVLNIETKLNQAIEFAQKSVESCQRDLEKNNTAIAKAETEKEQIQNNLHEVEKSITQYENLVQQWLQDYATQNQTELSYSALVSLLTFSEEWRKAEQTALRKIDDELTTAKTILSEREKALQTHKEQKITSIHTQNTENTNSLQDLKNLATSTKLHLEQSKKTKNEIDFRLQEDKSNKEKVSDLLKAYNHKKEIEANWAKLNAEIGSGDGKKFRQFAQEYTLDVLLNYANIYLEMLTSRYQIERIPQTLGLQVLDKDMGNEIRTVFSLSGGESFLLSLALALGLASLSSNKMKVESLFIDEGFGTLDPDTLNIAMDALERLHNQGRKVGVISHVQEMTERIQTQIRVNKAANGKSKVEIAG